MEHATWPHVDWRRNVIASFGNNRQLRPTNDHAIISAPVDIGTIEDLVGEAEH
jgi:hypothetical protein